MNEHIFKQTQFSITMSIFKSGKSFTLSKRKTFKSISIFCRPFLTHHKASWKWKRDDKRCELLFGNLRDKNENNKHPPKLERENIFNHVKEVDFHQNSKVASLFDVAYSMKKPSSNPIHLWIGLEAKQTLMNPMRCGGDEINSTLQSRNFNFPSLSIWSFSRLFFIFFRSGAIFPTEDVLYRTGGWVRLVVAAFTDVYFSFYQFPRL